MLERAIRAVADKRNTTKSKAAAPKSDVGPATAPPGNSPSTPDLASFSAFHSSSVEHLLQVAKDICILFKSAEGSPAHMVALLQARELAQVELAAARKQIELDAAKAKEDLEQAAAIQGAVVDPSQVQPKDEPLSNSGKFKVLPSRLTRRRVARRPHPIGHRPVTRQARALGKGSQ
jgi:hypothetical protein